MASASFRRQLRGDGACTLVMLAGVPHVGPRRSHDADEVKTSMFEEPLVLGGKDRVYEHDRQIFIAHGAPLLTRAVKKIGNELRFDFSGIKVSSAGRCRRAAHRSCASTSCNSR